MKKRLHLDGIVTVLNTPFTEDDRIDEAALAANVKYALSAGVVGFLVPAMAAEVGTLSMSERLTMVGRVVSAAEGRVPTIGGASAASAGERLEAARLLVEAGCAGILASIPYTDEADYAEEVLRLADVVGDRFLMLQDWDASGYGLPVPLVVDLFESVPAFRALKVEVVPAGPKYTELLAATNGLLHVSGGWAVAQMIEALDRGVHAFMPTGLHRAYVEIHRLYSTGDRSGAARLHRRLLPILAFSNQHLDISIHFFKRLLRAQGIYPTSNIRAGGVFDLVHEAIADELIREALEIEDELAGAVV